MSSNKKKWNKTEKTEKTRKNNSDESDFNKWDTRFKFLNPFKFDPKRNIGGIISSSSDDKNEGVEYKVKQISDNEWCKCSAKAVVGRCSSK